MKIKTRTRTISNKARRVANSNRMRGFSRYHHNQRKRALKAEKQVEVKKEKSYVAWVTVIVILGAILYFTLT